MSSACKSAIRGAVLALLIDNATIVRFVTIHLRIERYLGL